MEALALALEPHKETVGLTAAAITVLQFFSGFLVLNDIRRKGNTDGFIVGPFLGGTVFCLLNIQFGQMLGDDGMIKVNFIGLVLNVIYVCGFYLYTAGPGKTKVWGQIGVAGAVAVGILSYVQYEDPKLVEFRFGIILTIILLLLVGMPLLGLGDIIKNKSTAGLPFPIIVTGSLVSLSWLVYGIVIRSNFLMVQNALALFLCSIQLALFAIYPNTHVKGKKKSPKKKTN